MPVLLDEVVGALRPDRGGLFVDCTLGLGGHTRALLEAGATRVIGIDRDRSALLAAADAARRAGRSRRVRARRLPAAAGGPRRRGASSACRACWPTSACRRCSSTPRDAGSASGATSRSTCAWTRAREPTAADLVNQADEEELANAIFRFGEERYSRRIARALVAARPITTTGELAAVVRRAVPTRGLAADRSGDADVPGAAHLGERRARRARSLRVGRRRSAGARRAAGGDHVPLARGPHRQAHDARIWRRTRPAPSAC